MSSFSRILPTAKLPKTDANQATTRRWDSVSAHPIPDGVKIELNARANLSLNLDEAEQCLDNAMGKVLMKYEREEERR